MNTTAQSTSVLELPCYVAGEPVSADGRLEVTNPYTGQVAGTVATVRPSDAEDAIEAARAGGPVLTRYQRYEILEKARQLLTQRAEAFGDLIRAESGLCRHENAHEVTRSQDVLLFAAMEALRDDGAVFSSDLTPHANARKIFALRDPVGLTVAITPFNHPLNQVVHKLAPAIAAGTPVILKPSDKTPLTAIRFAELLYEAGLPPWMLSVVLGPIADVVEPLIIDERVKLLCFTGSVRVGKRIAGMAGYKKLCLELGGNAPLLILKGADMDLAVQLAAEGCYRNAGQRCTAVKRLLVQDELLADFTDRLVKKTESYVCGDPADPATRVGPVIDEAAADALERVVQAAVKDGAKVLCGGTRSGALMPPTVICDVPRTAEMVVSESFGPLAPILAVRDIDDAIELANSTDYGLAAGIVTNNMNDALAAVKRLSTGAVNVNEVPGFRIEISPFGGIKDSGLGIKEGVIEAIKLMSNVKTFSLPW